MPGLTDEGFVARRQPEILRLLERRLAEDDDLQGVNLRAGPIQQLLGALSEQLAEVYEAAEETYASQYASASGVSLDRVAALTGTTRRPATRSTVIVDCTLTSGTTLPVGSIVARDGDADVQFVSLEEVTATADDDYPVRFECTETGPIAAPAASLTVIVTPVAGWTAATNVNDATIGRARAEDPELREQRRVELAALGRGSLAAIRAAIARVEGDSPDDRPVREVRVYENVTSGTVSGRPPKSIEAVVWDGDPGEADDDKIAQAIWNTKGGGIEAYGGGESGTAIDAETGEEHTVAFTRATPVRVYVDATVVLVPGATAGWADAAKAALAAHAQASFRVGRTAYATQLACALLDLPDVEEVVELFVGTAPSPSASSVAIAEDEVATVDTVDITLAEA